MNGKRSIKKNERNFPVKKSIRMMKQKVANVTDRENRDMGKKDDN